MNGVRNALVKASAITPHVTAETHGCPSPPETPAPGAFYTRANVVVTGCRRGATGDPGIPGIPGEPAYITPAKRMRTISPLDSGAELGVGGNGGETTTVSMEGDTEISPTLALDNGDGGSCPPMANRLFPVPLTTYSSLRQLYYDWNGDAGDYQGVGLKALMKGEWYRKLPEGKRKLMCHVRFVGSYMEKLMCEDDEMDLDDCSRKIQREVKIRLKKKTKVGFSLSTLNQYLKMYVKEHDKEFMVQFLEVHGWPCRRWWVLWRG